MLSCGFVTLQLVTGVQDPRAAERAKLQAAKEKARAELASKGRMVPPSAKPPVPRAKTGAKSNIVKRADVLIHPTALLPSCREDLGSAEGCFPLYLFLLLPRPRSVFKCASSCLIAAFSLLLSVCTVANGAAHAKLERRPVAPAVNPWEARRLKALSESGPEQLPNGHAAAPAAAPPAAEQLPAAATEPTVAAEPVVDTAPPVEQPQGSNTSVASPVEQLQENNTAAAPPAEEPLQSNTAVAV